tara:strand:- start:42721 stop:42993 length:273 start_codon:yes stop_codon:yes gene_type:complete
MSSKAGYHLRDIERGVYGELSKLREELAELEDALEQGVAIMAMVEASDLYGALEAFVSEKWGLTMEDLQKMSAVTKRAFNNGHREPRKCS